MRLTEIVVVKWTCAADSASPWLTTTSVNSERPVFDAGGTTCTVRGAASSTASAVTKTAGRTNDPHDGTSLGRTARRPVDRTNWPGPTTPGAPAILALTTIPHAFLVFQGAPIRLARHALVLTPCW